MIQGPAATNPVARLRGLECDTACSIGHEVQSSFCGPRDVAFTFNLKLLRLRARTRTHKERCRFGPDRLLLLGVEGAGERGIRLDAEDLCPATDNHHVEV